MRKYDAGIMELGLIYNNWMAVPPRMPAFTLSGVCVSECTGAGLPGPGITVFGSQLHTHGAGRVVETSLVRGDTRVEERLNWDPHYSTHFQEIRTLERSVRVRPGDALVTSCTYDTRDRGNITLGGFGFTEEMCVNYIHYYPRQDLEICKSSISKQDLDHYFKTLADDESQDTSGDNSVEQNYRSVHWSQRRSRELGQLYDHSHVQMQCQTGTGASLPGNWESMEQPVIRRPDVVKMGQDLCKKASVERANKLEDGDADAIEEMGDLARDKRFRMNNFEDEWDEYDSWGVDKRTKSEVDGPSHIMGWDRRMDHSPMDHMGKRENPNGISKNSRYYLRLSRKLGSM